MYQPVGNEGVQSSSRLSLRTLVKHDIGARRDPIVVCQEGPGSLNFEFAELNLNVPFAGEQWYNCLYWTNFPPLSLLSDDPENKWIEEMNKMAHFKLAPRWVSFSVAREDLCKNAQIPNTTHKLKCEVVAYEGVRNIEWDYPMKMYRPHRGNHTDFEIQMRRFWDNSAVHIGIDGESFSTQVCPLQDLDCSIHVADYVQNPTWSYYWYVLRVNGWPYRISKIGTFEGCSKNGQVVVDLGMFFSDEQIVWQLLEGGSTMAPTGPNGELEIQPNVRSGQKFWAQLHEFDYLGPKNRPNKLNDPEVPVEKGFVWFTVEETITVPSTGQKGVKITLLDEGIVPCWLDLKYLQVFAGGLPLGYFNESSSDEPPKGSISVNRVLGSNSNVPMRKIAAQNEFCRIVFDDPRTLTANVEVDLGWAIRDCCYKGAEITLGPRPGQWVKEVEGDSGCVVEKSGGLPLQVGDPKNTHGSYGSYLYQDDNPPADIFRKL